MFSSRGRTPLVRINGTLNQYKYIDILKQYVLLFREQYHSIPMNFICQHDGRETHQAKSVACFLDGEDVEVLPWPAQSPDLNLIENVWAVIEHQLRQLYTYPTTVDALFIKLCKIRNSTPDTYFNNLIASMTSRCRAISKFSGSASFT